METEHSMDAIKAVMVPINREGYRFIAIFAIATIILFWIADPLGWLGVVLTCWCVYFFRDPDRMTPSRGELSRGGKPIRLTDVETALLGAFAMRSGEILDRDELISLTGAGGGGRAIDVQVTRLRRKIEQDPKLPRYLQTVRGKGYVLRPD